MTLSPQNLFLSGLRPEQRETLLAHAVEVDLPLRTPLYEAEENPKYAYFMTSGLASVVLTMAEGGTAEVGIIGREGIVGSVHLLGGAPVPTRCFIQLRGTALRVGFGELREAFRSSEAVRDRVLEFIQQQTLILSQLAGCNRLHGVEERLARWLLMVGDVAHTEVISLTQEFLAEMLGAQRTTVTLVAGMLQSGGMIEYRRGNVRIVDRENLENAACDCYQVIKRLANGLYKQADSASTNLGHM